MNQSDRQGTVDLYDADSPFWEKSPWLKERKCSVRFGNVPIDNRDPRLCMGVLASQRRATKLHPYLFLHWRLQHQFLLLGSNVIMGYMAGLSICPVTTSLQPNVVQPGLKIITRSLICQLLRCCRHHHRLQLNLVHLLSLLQTVSVSADCPKKPFQMLQA